jgi:hypothetical protein
MERVRLSSTGLSPGLTSVWPRPLPEGHPGRQTTNPELARNLRLRQLSLHRPVIVTKRVCPVPAELADEIARLAERYFREEREKIERDRAPWGDAGRPDRLRRRPQPPRPPPLRAVVEVIEEEPTPTWICELSCGDRTGVERSPGAGTGATSTRSSTRPRMSNAGNSNVAGCGSECNWRSKAASKPTSREATRPSMNRQKVTG